MNYPLRESRVTVPMKSCSGRKRPSKIIFGGRLFLPKGTGTSLICRMSLGIGLMKQNAVESHSLEKTSHNC